MSRDEKKTARAQDDLMLERYRDFGVRLTKMESRVEEMFALLLELQHEVKWIKDAD